MGVFPTLPTLPPSAQKPIFLQSGTTSVKRLFGKQAKSITEEDLGGSGRAQAVGRGVNLHLENSWAFGVSSMQHLFSNSALVHKPEFPFPFRPDSQEMSSFHPRLNS